jgi:hypothetical protein
MAAMEQITLKCPLCSQEHEYPLTVERSISFGATQAGPVGLRSFVRLFTCPGTSAQFEATLTLSESALNRINDLSVGAPTVTHERG